MRRDDSTVEALLDRYRPMGPSAGLRGRVLRSTERRRSRRGVAGRLAIAALLALSLGLDLAARQLMQETAAALGAGQIEWTPEAEEAARMLDGDGAGRRYMMVALAAGAGHREGFPLQMPASDFQKGMR